jgi:FkbM family methyltransferase
MLISLDEIVAAWAIRPSGVVHIGAHAAEESNDYERHGWGPVTWIEANPKLIERLRIIVPEVDSVICAALWDEDEKLIKFSIATNGESSSLLEPAAHLVEHPDIKFETHIQLSTKRLDSILNEIPNFLNLDVQGAELHVLRGLGRLIESLDYVYTEVNEKELYRNCALLEDLDEFMNFNGFSRVCLRRNGRSGWGDALYVRSDLRLRHSLRVSLKTFSKYLKFRAYLFYGGIRRYSSSNAVNE